MYLYTRWLPPPSYTFWRHPYRIPSRVVCPPTVFASLPLSLGTTSAFKPSSFFERRVDPRAVDERERYSPDSREKWQQFSRKCSAPSPCSILSPPHRSPAPLVARKTNLSRRSTRRLPSPPTSRDYTTVFTSNRSINSAVSYPQQPGYVNSTRI